MTVRSVSSPLTPAMLEPLDARVHAVEIRDTLDDREYPPVAELVHQHPDVALRIRGQHADLEFLRYFPFVRRVDVTDVLRLESLDGLRHLSELLEHLSIGDALRPLRLGALARFGALDSSSAARRTSDSCRTSAGSSTWPCG